MSSSTEVQGSSMEVSTEEVSKEVCTEEVSKEVSTEDVSKEQVSTEEVSWILVHGNVI